MNTQPAPRHGAVVRFAGDSGDGMQLAGTRFTATAALAGNDLATFPDYPAEIRAPAGTLGGVSAFQVHFGDHEILTPGDSPDVLVAMNPAALKTNLGDLPKGGTLIINSGAFTKKNLEHAKYENDPRETGELEAYSCIEVDANDITLKAVDGLGLDRRAALRSRNFFALGLLYWLFERDTKKTEEWIAAKYAKDEGVKEANTRALKAGYNYGDTHELAVVPYRIPEAKLKPGHYRNISGNEALGLGLMAAADRSGLKLFYSGYPITPASDILHFLSRHKAHGVRTFQAEDEIAAICAAIGASYAGVLAVTASSGPGIALKTEGMGLAVILETPLVIINVQRGGPSTGLPTKVEQTDLNQVLYGRSGEAPLPVVAAQSPGDCFDTVIEAARIAIRYMTPVVVLSDAYLANGTEPWHIPTIADIPAMAVEFAKQNGAEFLPYKRDEKLARPWAIPGTPGLEHRIGGLEKEDLTGNISYDGDNHEKMVRLRAQKIAQIDVPDAEVYGEPSGDLLVLGWGGTFGAIRETVRSVRERGHAVSHVHLRHLNPLPKNLGQLLSNFKQVIVPELNSGQLAQILRAKYLLDIQSLNKIQGKPFSVSEISDALLSKLESH